MQKDRDKIFTVLVVSSGGKPPLSLQFRLKAIRMAGIVCCCAVIGFSSLILSHSILSKEVIRVQALEEENAGYMTDIKKQEKEIASLVGQMAELEVLGREVEKIIAGASTETPLASRSRLQQGATLDEAVQFLKEAITVKEEEMDALVSKAENYQAQMAVTPDFWPASGRVTSPFGWRRSPITRIRHFHSGIDIGAKHGSSVLSAADGTVREARWRPGWGNLIIIRHGEYVTYYAHLSRINVSVGQRVNKGELIGKVGSTGYSTGPHLHFEVHKNGTAIDPLILLQQREVAETEGI